MSSLGGRSGQVVNRVVEARWASLTEWYVYDRTTDALEQRRVRVGCRPGAPPLAPDRRRVRLVTSSRSLSTVRNFHRVHQLGFAVQLPDSNRRHPRALVGHQILLDAARTAPPPHRCSPRSRRPAAARESPAACGSAGRSTTTDASSRSGYRSAGGIRRGPRKHLPRPEPLQAKADFQPMSLGSCLSGRKTAAWSYFARFSFRRL